MSGTVREVACIRDDSGVRKVSWKFIREHPDWYAYVGHYRLNSEIRHVFVMVTQD